MPKRRNFFLRIYDAVYAKVRTYLLGGTAGAGAAAGVLWLLTEGGYSQAGDPQVIAVVTFLATQVVGFLASALKYETHPAGSLQPVIANGVHELPDPAGTPSEQIDDLPTEPTDAKEG